MEYLVTTNKDLLPATPIAMVDGTVPGYQRREGDLHCDHHRVGGGCNTSCERIVPLYEPIGNDYTIVTTQVDADACVAAAWIQLYPHILPNDQARLRAIAFDCDHLAVPDELAEYADFAAQAVAAMKSERFKLPEALDLPKDRKQWTEADKVRYASESFRQGTEWLIAAVKGDRPYPGELGEAAEYWQQVKDDEQKLIDENRITKYNDALVFNMLGWSGRYGDPRASLRAAKRLELSAILTLTQRETQDGSGWSYTLASSSNNLVTGFDAFKKLTVAEAQSGLMILSWF